MLLSEGICAYLRSITGVLAPATVVFYERRLPSLVSFLGDIELSGITLDQLRAWRVWLYSRAKKWGGGSSRPEEAGGYSPFTLHQYVRSCRRLFKWLELENRIPASPARRLELPVLPKQYRRGLKVSDRDRLLDEAELRGSLRDYAILILLADTACRIGGLVGLRLEDLDLEQCRAVVREKGRGGQRKERDVYFLKSTRQALRDYLNIRPRVSHDYVFCSRVTLQPLTYSGFYQVIERLAQKAGVRDGWNPHNWRHGAIRGMLASGMPLPAASQIAGHSSVQVTGDIYGVFDENELQRMHRECSWVR
jgi:site-specific recombinase XerD